MTLRAPKLMNTAIISDDAYLAARLTSAVAKRFHYLSVMDGPRLKRPDAQAEIARRNNALARIKANDVILSGLSDDQVAAMSDKLPNGIVQVRDHADVDSLASTDILNNERLKWGRENIGVGLLKALYEGRLIEFEDNGPATATIIGHSKHHVVCEAGDKISEIIASNYAYSLGASLTIIPEVDTEVAEPILEQLYSSENGKQRLNLQTDLFNLCGGVKFPNGASLTFFTKKLPFGIGFPSHPSTHIFNYPDCGVSVMNGFAAEQSDSRGVNVAVLVDPEKTPAPEIDAATKVLPKKRVFVRGYRGEGAEVSSISDMVDHFPYDLLLFATHCGDADGWRWTYEFTDSEGLDRRLIVDIAIGIGRTDDNNLLRVMQFSYFHSLDGVDWDDPVAKADLYVGSAIKDYADWSGRDDFEPVHKEPLDRVKSSAAMAMFDNNYIPMPTSLAGNGTPIVINNACVSWHELAARFTFGNARAYIGTLFPVLPFEAESVVNTILDKHWGKLLPEALWLAQVDTYGTSDKRRPYVMTGVYIQKLRSTREDVPKHIMQRLSENGRYYAQRVELSKAEEKKDAQHVHRYYQNEATAFYK
ncbi:hypothetical protein LCGC14_0269670 [marine sediment metagenome]|uniref:Uncharacterized protein n=2 Tax=root TaxID=1 RepID=A0A7V1BIZ0_9RHOB|nr:hypothetical protein [Sulfitobacter litoralis]HDZ53818.1 hypothetical protein [Sulfitobacter litoralis]